MRLQAIRSRRKTYDDSTPCAKHGSYARWTGSGRRTCCFPRARGTMAQAMSVLFKGRTITLGQAEADGLPLFNSITCKRGHTAWRYVRTPHICPDCARYVAARKARETEAQRQRALAAYRDATATVYGLDYQTARALGIK